MYWMLSICIIDLIPQFQGPYLIKRLLTLLYMPLPLLAVLWPIFLGRNNSRQPYFSVQNVASKKRTRFLDKQISRQNAEKQFWPENVSWEPAFYCHIFKTLSGRNNDELSNRNAKDAEKVITAPDKPGIQHEKAITDDSAGSRVSMASILSIEDNANIPQKCATRVAGVDKITLAVQQVKQEPVVVTRDWSEVEVIVID